MLVLVWIRAWVPELVPDRFWCRVRVGSSAVVPEVAVWVPDGFLEARARVETL